jgi:hypothetical protein
MFAGAIAVQWAGRSVRLVEDPFAVLGLGAGASLDDVRAARRRLAKELHPDHGGDEVRMQEVNRAFDAAVRALLRPAGSSSSAGGVAGAGAGGATSARPAAPPRRSAPPRGAGDARQRLRVPSRPVRWVEQDAASFTIELLPVEAFEALVVVTGWYGEVLVDDPPYLLEVHLQDPSPCWCRFELMPEAGGSMIGITVAGIGSTPPPPLDDVRDLYVEALNQLGREV